MSFAGFSKDFFAFFRQLERNNEREWFEANKARYRSEVLGPLSDFIVELAPRLAKISPHFKCDPRPIGGSIFRIHRDLRFAKDKTPYKTHAGAHFRHTGGEDVHAPGYYLHLEPGEVLFGGGLYLPPPPALAKVRDRIASDPKGWKKVLEAKSITGTFGGLSDGDSLSRPPKGYPADHPFIEDLKRKSFYVMRTSDEKAAASSRFLDQVAKTFAAAAPVMRYLCEAVGAEY